MPPSFTWLDHSILISYLIAIVAISALIARRQKTGSDYFLANRSMSAWKLAMSITANQVSAVSLISAPAFVALHSNGGMRWLQYELAVPFAMLLLIGFLLPALRSVQGASIYELAEQRFGRAARQVLALTFLLSRGLALGVILYASAVVTSVVFGIGIYSALFLVGATSVAYTTLGGITADIWTDIIQLVLLWSGVLAAVIFLIYHNGIGLSSIPPSRMQTLIFSTTGFDGTDFSFWPMLFGGLFLYMSYYGCDQSQAQRLLAAQSNIAARRALVFSALLRFPLVLTYCFFGLLLAALMRSDASFAAAVADGPIENLVPQFVVHYLPSGLRGLFVAAIFAAAMSSIDSAMNSLAAVTLEDVFGKTPETQNVWLSRTVSLAWGLFAIGSALVFARTADSLIIVMNRIGSAFAGPILAAFALAVCSRHVKGAHAIVGLFSGLAGTLLLAWFLPGVSWLWWNPLGFFITGGVALLLSGAGIRIPDWNCPRKESQILIGTFLIILFTLAVFF